MKSIGNVFDATRPDPAAPRGPDLAVAVEVPRKRLGRSCTVHIPERLDLDGALVERARSPHDDHPGAITLHLPEGLPEGAVLRLRGQGGVGGEGSVPGDLYVRITVVDREPTAEEGDDEDDDDPGARDDASTPTRVATDQRGGAGMLLIAIGLVLALILLAMLLGQR